MEWLTFKVIEREPAFRGQVFVRGLAVRKEEILLLEELSEGQAQLILKNGKTFELVDKFRDIVRRLNIPMCQISWGLRSLILECLQVLLLLGLGTTLWLRLH